MHLETNTLLEIVRELNPRPNDWSFLTSIEEMLGSKLYMDSLHEDIDTIKEYLPSKERLHILDFGTGCGAFAVFLRMVNPTLRISTIRDD